jgi:hypothetical protein
MLYNSFQDFRIERQHITVLLHPVRNLAVWFSTESIPPSHKDKLWPSSTVLLKGIYTYSDSRNFLDERLVFLHINVIPHFISMLKSFRLIKVIYIDFYGIFSGP